MSGARMQEIADEAGINKALLHYYYRSKEQLFSAVFQEILIQILPQLFSIFKSDLPLEVKIYQLAERYVDFLQEHPEMPLFVLSELQRDPQQLFENLELSKVINLDNLKDQLISEAEKGNIRPISIEQFMINIVSMMVFPFAARPMFQRVLSIEDEAYAELLESRKTEVPKFFMSALRP